MIQLSPGSVKNAAYALERRFCPVEIHCTSRSISIIHSRADLQSAVGILNAMKNYPSLYGAPLSNPIEAKLLLRDPELHWKKGRSAYEAAHAWMNRNTRNNGGMPSSIRALLNEATEWKDAEIVAGFFEHATPLDTHHGPSSNDVLAICRLSEALGVIAVEAKAGEPFGEVVSVWNSTPGKTARLKWACDFFGIDPATSGGLRWQLFHRTASAIIEAKRFHAPRAIMLIHDFSADASWLDDYLAFAKAIGVEGSGAGKLSDRQLVQGVALRLAWVRDGISDG